MNFDINNFGPFQSDVWGSFSDWVMLIVTFFTLLYLIKTLKAQHNSLEIQQKTLASQLAVQQAQQLSIEIEQKRYLAEVRPDVDFVFDWESMELKIAAKNRALNISKFTLDEIAEGFTMLLDIRRLQEITIPVNSSFRIYGSGTKVVEKRKKG